MRLLHLLFLSVIFQSSAWSEAPNIIIFMTDDQSWEQFNFLPEGRDASGLPKNLTPNLDRIAREGVVLTRFYSNSSVCTPARYNLLTGQYASRAKGIMPSLDGMLNVEWNTRVFADTHNLASELKQAGYQTAMVGKNHVIYGKNEKDLHTFKRNDPITQELTQKLIENQEITKQWIRDAGFDYASHIYHSNIPINAPKALEYHNLEWILQGAQQFWDTKTNHQPYFMFFPITTPHGPHHARAHRGNPLATPIGFLKQAPGGIPSREDMIRRVKSAGLSEKTVDFTYMDDILGAVIKGIEDRGERDSTILFLMTDHGINDNSKGHLYDGGTRSPLVVWGPGYFKPRHNSTALSQMIDLAPTIFNLAGHQPSSSMNIDGKSLLPLLNNQVDQIHESIQLEIGLSRAIVTDRYKYLTIRETENHKQLGQEGRKKLLDKSIKFHREVEGREPHNTDPMAPFGHMGKTPGSTRATATLMKNKPCYFDEDQIFDLDKDPQEVSNLFNDPEKKSLVKQMKRSLIQNLQKMPGTYAEFKTKAQTP